MGLPVNVTLGLDKLVETVANATGKLLQTQRG